MLQHDKGAIKKLIVGEVVRREGPSAYRSFNNHLAIFIKMEIPAVVSRESSFHRVHLRRFE